VHRSPLAAVTARGGPKRKVPPAAGRCGAGSVGGGRRQRQGPDHPGTGRGARVSAAVEFARALKSPRESRSRDARGYDFSAAAGPATCPPWSAGVAGAGGGV
jgi:hypothetical protein